jgi:alpha-D-ribose 1-methylphosphonate 5-phosphate C-P lyase
METRAMHAYEEYGLQYVSLYENVSAFGRIAATAGYPVMVDERYLMSPSPIPKFDNPKLHNSQALMLFGAGREKRIYAIPPHTAVISLDFEDHPFEIPDFAEPCGLCAATGVYLDEIVLDDQGGRLMACSDTDFCEQRRAQGHHGTQYGSGPRASGEDVS